MLIPFIRGMYSDDCEMTVGLMKALMKAKDLQDLSCLARELDKCAKRLFFWISAFLMNLTNPPKLGTQQLNKAKYRQTNPILTFELLLSVSAKVKLEASWC